jgi:hypothetical protein
MKLFHYDDAAKFLKHAKHFLEAQEAENNLILGVCSWFAAHPERIKQTPYFAIVEENKRIEAAAMMTPPHKLVLTRAKAEILGVLVNDLLQRRVVLPGVNGPGQTSLAFAKRWAKKKRCTYRLRRSLRIYQLSHVTPPRPVSGRMRLGLAMDKDVMVEWTENFGKDIGEPQSKEEAAETVEQLVKDERLYVWDDDGLRSIATWTGPTTHGVRIGLVYTLPEFRCKGYASACVAALSRAMLNSGRRFCYLFTDLSNPVSNRIYRRIGYVPVCDFVEYQFT